MLLASGFLPCDEFNLFRAFVVDKIHFAVGSRKKSNLHRGNL